MLPETLIVPDETETTAFLLLVPLPGIAILAAFKVPDPTEIVLLSDALGGFIVIAPETVSEFELLIVIPLVVLAATTSTDAQLALEFTVTTFPD